MTSSATVRAIKIPPEIGMLLMAAAIDSLEEAGPCSDPTCEGCAHLREQTPAGQNIKEANGQGTDQTAHQEACLTDAIRQDLDIITKARQTEDANVLQYLSTRIRAVSQQLLDADLAKPRDDEAVAMFAARLQHLRNTRSLFEARAITTA